MDLPILVFATVVVLPKGPAHPHVYPPESLAIQGIHILVFHELRSVRQDNPIVGIPFKAILEQTQSKGAVATDSVSAMVLRLLALMLDDEFQAISKAATEAHNGKFKATEPKGHHHKL